MSARKLVEKPVLLLQSCIVFLWCHRGTTLGSILLVQYHHPHSQYILTVADYSTKFVEAVPMPTKHAEGNLFKVKFMYKCFAGMKIYIGFIFNAAIYEDGDSQSNNQRPRERV